MAVFGESFSVESSSELTLSPDTVLRAALGISLQSLVSGRGLLLPLKQLAYAIEGKHRLSATTKATVIRAMGPMGEMVKHALDEVDLPPDAQESSDWIFLLSVLQPASEDDFIFMVVQHMAALDELCLRLRRLAREGRQEEIETQLASELGDFSPHWRALRFPVCWHITLRIEASLRVLALLESTPSVGGKIEDAGPSVVLALMQPTAKPIGHWMRQLQKAVSCSNNKSLADLLARKPVLHRRRLISHDTLKGWSSMKPGMLITHKACNSLLSILGDRSTAEMLQARFALARFLAFLCDFLRSSVAAETLTWAEAQDAISVRYGRLLANAINHRSVSTT